MTIMSLDGNTCICFCFRPVTGIHVRQWYSHLKHQPRQCFMRSYSPFTLRCYSKPSFRHNVLFPPVFFGRFGLGHQEPSSNVTSSARVSLIRSPEINNISTIQMVLRGLRCLSCVPPWTRSHSVWNSLMLIRCSIVGYQMRRMGIVPDRTKTSFSGHVVVLFYWIWMLCVNEVETRFHASHRIHIIMPCIPSQPEATIEEIHSLSSSHEGIMRFGDSIACLVAYPISSSIWTGSSSPSRYWLIGCQLLLIEHFGPPNRFYAA